MKKRSKFKKSSSSSSPNLIGHVLKNFEDILFANNEMQDSPTIVALAPNFDQNGCTVGLGYVDITKRVLGLEEFLDDSHFTNLESALVALGCKEYLVPVEIGH
ncbi:hypothetical protein CQW23_14368 [Capsicum baccatum]|uniref:DNA mismatch repair protein MutS connector domain-containing protein n=1 Tax=Capsicum baccatum TaxID=33114 RepID=A0A2G2WJ92_CAPBA|nr:hypothetical protein CQW23_14368 [Capsicum baccatum]